MSTEEQTKTNICPCIYCGQTGRQMCRNCGGTGIHKFPDGRIEQCSSCGGTGSKTCTTCNGSGSMNCLSLISSVKNSTIDFLKSYKLEKDNLDYIDEKLILIANKAIPANAKAFQDGGKSINIDILNDFKDEKTLLGQWSGYIYNVVDLGDRITFYTSCGVTGTPQYMVYKSQIFDIRSAGICYQFSLYYMTCNL